MESVPRVAVVSLRSRCAQIHSSTVHVCDSWEHRGHVSPTLVSGE